jgi:NAD(P)-dependent dehydrogenase (short-subunit alcohol dehydrogenase family)
MTDLQGRIAFITGGANGIGLGIARALARHDVKIALADIDQAALDAVQAELSAITSVHTVRLDVRDRDAYADAAKAVESALGPVSLLVNNAGVAGGAPADKLTYELWDWGMGINLGGVVNGVQTFLPRMIERGHGGHVVNTASIAGLYADISGILYHTAKFGVVGLSEALAIELEPNGIGVTLLCPGAVATGIVERTRTLQPRVTSSMTAEQKRKAFAQFEINKDVLARGSSPDAVGAAVVAAMRENQLYVLTSNVGAEEIAARSEAILAAMPAEQR